MENKGKFRLRLNLFDGIVLLLAVLVGGFVLWNHFKPAAAADGPADHAATVTYTVRFRKWQEGSGELVQPGDKLTDNIKNFELGRVVSTQVVPAESMVLDQAAHQMVRARIPGYEDILVTVESPCTVGEEGVTLGGGYPLRVGATTFIKGAGYMGSGPVIAIEREEQA